MTIKTNPRGTAGIPVASKDVQSIETNSVMHLVSAGPVVGLWDTVTPGQSVYFNGTPVQNSDKSFNYPGVRIEQRTGTASQTAISGFTQAQADFNVDVNIAYGPANAVTRTTSSALIDAVNVTVMFPAGLSITNKKSGEVNPGECQLKIMRRAPSGTGNWETVVDADVITGRAEQGYEQTYYVPRPTTAGAWDVKVERLTPDDADQYSQSKVHFRTLTEIQDVKQTYNGSAYVALKYDAKAAPDAVPQLFDFGGLLCHVPSNYNPVTRVYTGTWNGTLSGTLQWTDNPAWHLYELLTNAEWGLGDRITPAMIDLASFYAAAKYNDELVPDGKGGTEPRFRFNAQLSTQDDSWKIVQNLAGAFNASVFIGSGLVTLVQDRPVTTFTLVTKADVSAEGFSYSSSARSARHTAVAMSFTDEDDASNTRVILEPQAGDSIYGPFQTRYGYQYEQLAAWGCTSEGQARRAARWVLDTELYSTDIITYKAPLSHFNVNPGSVIKVMDNDWANSIESGKVLSVVGTTVTLDRPVTISSGTVLIDVLLADGKTVEQKTVTTSPGTASTITVASAFSQSVTPGATFIVSGSISPRYFRVTNIAESDDGFYQVSALFYDPAKYARIENGTVVPAVIYSDTSASSIPAAPWGLRFNITGSLVSETAVHGLLVNWQPPSTGAASYTLQFRRRGSAFTVVQDIYTTSYELKNVLPGTYDVSVQAVSRYGVTSAPVNGVYSVSLDGGVQPLTIAPVTGVQVVGGGTSFSGQDVFFEWTNPASNQGKNPALKNFAVNIYTTGGTLLRSFNVDPVAAGNKATASYSYGANLTDGGPRRSIRVDVIARDVLNNTTSATSATLTNAAPAVPGSIVVTGGLRSNKLSFTLPTDSDFKGVLVWRSTTSGFTPALANLIYDGSDNSVIDSGLADATTYYYKVAAYDQFSKDFTGTGLNVSAQYTATTSVAPGVNKGASLPGSATEGDLFFNTTDGKLYRYHSGAWTAAVPSSDLTGTLADSQLAAIAASKITGQITSTQITDNAVTTSKVASNSITTDKLLVTGRGKALNDDPACMDLKAWSNPQANASVVTNVSQPVGQYAIRITGAGQLYSRAFPIEAGKQYKVTAWARQVSGTGVFYLRQYNYNASNVLQNYIVTPISGGSYEGVTVPGSWTRYVGYITPTTGSVWAQLFIHTNWTGTGTTDLCDLRVEEYIGADLIVDGTITGSKIAGATITGSNIAGATITGDKIVGGTITAANIAGNTITASQISATAGITAGQIDTRGLTIKDAAGNVVFSAGVPLTSSYITPSSSWLNSNITVDSSGLLQGIGSGAGVQVDNSKQQWSQVQSKPGTDTQIVRNLIDASTWVVGNSGSQPGFNQNASADTTNVIVMGPAPDGITRPLWKAVSGTTNGGQGGWNGATGFAVDCNKTYRFSTWIKTSYDNSNGSYYLGLGGAAAVALMQSPGTTQGNPYFVADGRSNLVKDRWYLVVGYVYPYGTGGTQTNQSGVYDGVTGQKVRTGSDFVWFSNTNSTSTLRTFQYYTTTAGALQYWYAPRVEVCDGSESSIQEMLAPAIAAVAQNTNNVSLVNDTPLLLTIVGNTVTKSAGINAWDAAVHSKDSYTGGAYVSFIPAQTNTALMVGLNSAGDLSDTGWSSLDFAMYCTNSAGIYAAESGSLYSIGSYAVGDVLAVTFDGSNVRYLKNGVVLRTTATSTTAPLFLDSSFCDVGAKVTNIQFGPMSSNSWASIGGSGKPADNATVGATIGTNLSGQFNSGNISTYIASATIGLAQINTATIGSLSAITATIGTLRTATSGGRTEITDNVITVYDTSNAVRVKIGYLL